MQLLFFEDYLNTGDLSYVADTQALLAEVKETAAQPWRLFRIGTWELGDSWQWKPK